MSILVTDSGMLAKVSSFRHQILFKVLVSQYSRNLLVLLFILYMCAHSFRIAVVGVPSKSRVETQIKLCIQLLTDKGDKVSSWPYLKLPDHLLARSRLRRQQKSASPMSTDLPAEQDDQTIIHLDARVACASRPNDPVKMCIGCIQREVSKNSNFFPEFFFFITYLRGRY